MAAKTLEGKGFPPEIADWIVEDMKHRNEQKPLVGIEILTWTEGVGTKQVWLAAWKRFDLLTQGPTQMAPYE